jgi:hypothetical protein
VNLRQLAAADLQTILGDSSGGFGWPATLTDPDGADAAVTGTYRDIALALDLETGIYVTQRRASLVIPLAGLTARPRGIADGAKKPWLVALTDLQGIARTFKVAEAHPDELGCIVLILEAYELEES